MRADIQAILEKQAEWQRSRAKRPWAQKLRDSVAMRRTLTLLKKHPSPLSEKRPNQESCAYSDLWGGFQTTSFLFIRVG